MSTPVSTFPLFRDLDSEVLNLLNDMVEPFCYAPDTIIFQQGEPATHIYLLLHGQVDVCYKPYDGPTLVVAHINAGGVFGWSAAIGNRTYSSGAMAVEPSEGWRISGDTLRCLCKEDPQSAAQILDRLAAIVSSRWQDAHNQVRIMLANGMTQPKR